MKVLMSFYTRATMSREVEMTPADYEAFCERLDKSRGQAARRLEQELFNLSGLDFNDAEFDDDVELDSFDAAAPAKPDLPDEDPSGYPTQVRNP